MFFEEHEPPGPLVWLQAWYAAQCDDDWEHAYGVRIETLDNPGWQLRIDLTGTPLAGVPYERSEVARGEHDWVFTWVTNDAFEAACGPLNLGEAIHTFRLWAQAAGVSVTTPP